MKKLLEAKQRDPKAIKHCFDDIWKKLFEVGGRREDDGRGSIRRKFAKVYFSLYFYCSEYPLFVCEAR